MRTVLVAIAATMAAVLALGSTTSTIDAASAESERVEARDDYAGMYFDRDAKVFVYRFVGQAEGAADDLLAHYGDASKFRIDPAIYTMAELEALQEPVVDELEALGFDIREGGVDVVGNYLDLGIYGELGPVRAALAQYGDAVHVFWSEGGFIGDPPDRSQTAVKRSDGVKVRLTLDRAPLVAGRPAWITTKVTNDSDRSIDISLDCGITTVDVGGKLQDQTWRLGSPATQEHDWRGSSLWASDDRETVELRFVRDPVGTHDYGCDAIGATKTLKPGEAVEQRRGWDGQAGASWGPPPEGTARITGSLDVWRQGAQDLETIEVALETPVQGGPGPQVLHPMEAVDVALADPRFAELLAESDTDGRGNEHVLYDDEREAWVVGACGPKAGKRSYWRAAVVDPASAEVTEIIEGAFGRKCVAGP